MFQVVLDGVVQVDFLRVHILQEVALRTTFLKHALTLSLNRDAVQRLLRQCTILRHRAVLLFLGKLHLTVQHIVAERVVFVQKEFDTQEILGKIRLVNHFFSFFS